MNARSHISMIVATLLLLSSVTAFAQTLMTGMSNQIGTSSYEAGDHRSNVYEVTSDHKTYQGNTFYSQVVTFADYYPYGVTLGDRTGKTEYRFGFQDQEKDDEIKGEGNSINYSYRMHDSRVGRFFAVDQISDKYPELSTYQFSGNRVMDMVEVLGLEPDSSDALYASTAVYGRLDAKFYHPPGWKESELIFENKFIDDETGFKAKLYEREGDNGETEYLLAFAGTEDGKDVLTDINQVLILSSQYKQAVDLSREIAKEVGVKNLTITGHSLGGGLAAVSSFSTGAKAITFNAAAVSGNTKIWLNNYLNGGNKKELPFEYMEKNITAYIIAGEALYLGQQVMSLEADGLHKYVIPKAYKAQPGKLHGIYRFFENWYYDKGKKASKLKSRADD